MAPVALLAELGKLNVRPKCSDWGTRVQRLCEQTWETLSDQVGGEQMDKAGSAAVAEFLQQNDDAFALARLVIPQLRNKGGDDDQADGPLSQRQQALLENLREARGAATRTRFTNQNHVDHPLYREEKETMQDAQLHRVRLLLQHSGRFNDVSAEEITHWLENGPKEKAIEE